MKRNDLGIIMIHWMMAVVLLGAAVSGLCLWAKWLQPHLAFIFEPANIGVIHIGLSVAVVFIFSIYLGYLIHKRMLDHVAIRRPVAANWRRLNILLYWILFAVIGVETVSGVLLTKLINQDVLAKVFGIQKSWLFWAHLVMVAPILLFPAAHVTIHWLDGRFRTIFSMFRPHVYPRKPSMASIMVKLREENMRLKREKVGYDSSR